MLGNTIAALRKQQGLSQQALADRIYVVRQTISKWEKNLSVPDADALTRLADALNTTVETLLGAPSAPEDGPAVPSDVAQALSSINDQLVIQNRRRARIWRVLAWIVGLLLAFQIIVLVLGTAVYTAAPEPTTVEEYSVKMDE